MQIFGLYGSSGTGKSSRSLSLSHHMRIPAIIDDGLLILNGQKVAGTSAKYEKNKMTAIKRAIFHDSRHANEVKTAIKALSIEKILILGTSRGMIGKITEVLNLPEPMEWIAIEDIATSEEIRSALYTRRTEGKHVIPVPRVEVEKNLISKWIVKVQSIFSHDKKIIGESTIVFPRFQLGRIYIRDACVKDIIHACCRNTDGLISINKIVVQPGNLSDITIYVTIQYGKKIPEVAQHLQHSIQQALDKMLVYVPTLPRIFVTKLG